MDISTGEIKGQVKAERFAKQKREVWRKAMEKNVFTAAEERVLHRLAVCLEMNTNAIISLGGGYMSIEDMADAVCLDRSNFRKTIRGLIKKNAIGRFTSGFGDSYYMNPCLYEMGEVGSFLYYQFREEYGKKIQLHPNVIPLKTAKKVTSLIAGGMV